MHYHGITSDSPKLLFQKNVHIYGIYIYLLLVTSATLVVTSALLVVTKTTIFIVILFSLPGASRLLLC